MLHGPDGDGAVAAHGDHARIPVPADTAGQVVRGQERRQPRVRRGDRGLGGGPAEASPIAGQQNADRAGQQGRPGPQALAVQEADRQRPARQDRPERQHDGELTGVQVGRVGQRARHVRGHVEDHRDEQDLADHVRPGQEAPRYPQHRPGHQRHPGQVQQREGYRDGRPYGLGAEQREQPLRGHPGVLGPGVHRGEMVGQRVQVGLDQASGQRRQALGGDSRHGQGQLVPAGAQHSLDRGIPPPGQVTGHAQRAHRHQRHDAHQEGQRVGDEHPGQQQPDQDGDVPARRAPVDDQPGQQERHGGADVPEGQQQDEDADAELGGEHEARRQQHPGAALAAGYPAPGQQRREDHDQGVRHRRRDVSGVRVQPEQPHQQGVLGQLGGDERDVGQVPAVQQHVAVQHVPGHQQVVGLVGILRVGPGHPQVGEEEQRDGQRDRGGGEQAAGGHPAAGRALRLWLGGGPGTLPISGPGLGGDGQAGGRLRRPALRHGSHHVLRLGIILATECYSP